MLKNFYGSMIWLQKDGAFSTGGSQNDSRSPRHSGSFYSTGSNDHLGQQSKRSSGFTKGFQRLLGRSSAPPDEESVVARSNVAVATGDADNKRTERSSSWRAMVLRNPRSRNSSGRASDLDASAQFAFGSTPSSPAQKPNNNLPEAPPVDPPVVAVALSKPVPTSTFSSPEAVLPNIVPPISQTPSRVTSPTGSEDGNDVDAHLQVLALRIGDIGSAQVVSIIAQAAEAWIAGFQSHLVSAYAPASCQLLDRTSFFLREIFFLLSSLLLFGALEA